MPTNSELGAPLKAIIVGAGHRSMLYASYAKLHPDELQITGVVEPDIVRRTVVSQQYDLAPQRCFSSLDELPSAGIEAQLAINGTMDSLHVPTSIQLLERGYHILLEKPIGISEEEVLQLQRTARQSGRIVMICHVLRYAPFYTEIRRRVAAGEIGDLINIQLSENVSYHHMASVLVRGKWGRQDRGGSSILMQKCCHDLDLLAWMKSGIPPVRVTSAGGRMFFREQYAPPEAGTRCLADCPIESSCDYSARKHYIEMKVWGDYVWHSIEHLGPTLTVEQKITSLQTDNPYGRCVWRCDNDVADHQSVLVEFADGCTATHNLAGNTAKPCRSIHLVGTDGEIQGVLEDGSFVIRRRDVRPGGGFREEQIELGVSMDMHGGGDHRLVTDFLRVVKGLAPSLSTTSLDDSIAGHRIGFAADKAMEQKKWIDL